MSHDTLDATDERLREALRAASREVRKAHDEIARLQTMLNHAEDVHTNLLARIGRLQHLLLQHGHPVHQCQQRTGDSTL